VKTLIVISRKLFRKMANENKIPLPQYNKFKMLFVMVYGAWRPRLAHVARKMN